MLRRKSFTSAKSPLQTSCLGPYAIGESLFRQNFYLGISKGEMLALARSTIGYRVKFC